MNLMTLRENEEKKIIFIGGDRDNKTMADFFKGKDLQNLCDGSDCNQMSLQNLA